MSKTFEYTHMVFATKGRKHTISLLHRQKLIDYLMTLLRELDCFVYQINAMPDHVHMFFDKNKHMPTEDIARIVKGKASYWMRRCGDFPKFEAWGKEYFAGSISAWDKDMISGYIANQDKHHGNMTFVDEMKRLYAAAGLPWHDNDMA